MASFLDTTLGIVTFFVVVTVVFFLPTILAVREGHSRLGWIIVTNLFLGPTIIGWIVPWAIYMSSKGFLAEAAAASNDFPCACPACGRGYSLDAYRADAIEIACSYCHERFPRPGIEA